MTLTAGKALYVGVGETQEIPIPVSQLFVKPKIALKSCLLKKKKKNGIQNLEVK